MSVSQSQAVLLVTALFAVGVLVGGLGTHLYYTAGAVPEPEIRTPAGGFIVSRFQEELDLTPEQVEQARQILSEVWLEAGTLRDDLKPRVEQLLRGASEDLMAILTPEQRLKFERMRLDYRRRTERFLLGPPDTRQNDASGAAAEASAAAEQTAADEPGG